MVAATAEEKAEFGRRLRDLREALDLSADALAIKMTEAGAKVSGANIGAWERGQYGPRHRQQVRLLEQLLDAEGILGPLLGFSDDQVISRMDRIEARLAAVEKLLRQQGRRRGTR